MAAVGVFVAVLLYKHARTRRTGPAIGLGFASVCLAIGMILAASYVINLHVGPGYLTIERMVRTHGSINGFGFALVALVSFAFEAITTDPKNVTQTTRSVGRPKPVCATHNLATKLPRWAGEDRPAVIVLPSRQVGRRYRTRTGSVHSNS